MIRPTYPVCTWRPWQAAVAPARRPGPCRPPGVPGGTAPGRGRSQPCRQARDDRRPARADGDVLAGAITAPTAPFRPHRADRRCGAAGMPEHGLTDLPMLRAPSGAMALWYCLAGPGPEAARHDLAGRRLHLSAAGPCPQRGSRAWRSPPPKRTARGRRRQRPQVSRTVTTACARAAVRRDCSALGDHLLNRAERADLAHYVQPARAAHRRRAAASRQGTGACRQYRPSVTVFDSLTRGRALPARAGPRRTAAPARRGGRPGRDGAS
jgi:hypothetical protein